MEYIRILGLIISIDLNKIRLCMLLDKFLNWVVKITAVSRGKQKIF